MESDGQVGVVGIIVSTTKLSFVMQAVSFL